jgi:hypothetical protein
MRGQLFEMSDDLAVAYLGELDCLASEINIAMRAIATNALGDLVSSVAKQEMLCSSLAAMAGHLSHGSGSSLPLSLDVPIRDKVQLAITSIRNLTLQYSCVLKHSGRSIAILASLCRSHSGQFENMGAARLKRQTWSCEA